MNLATIRIIVDTCTNCGIEFIQAFKIDGPRIALQDNRPCNPNGGPYVFASFELPKGTYIFAVADSTTPEGRVKFYHRTVDSTSPPDNPTDAAVLTFVEGQDYGNLVISRP